MMPHLTASAQFQRLVPPPPCRVPMMMPLRVSARDAGARRPTVVVEPLDATQTELGSQHLPWALSTRLRERLGRAPGLDVASAGAVERAMLEAGGRADSAAALLGAEWIVRGLGRTVVNRTEITVELRRRGAPRPMLRGSYRLPAHSLAAMEAVLVRDIVRAVAGHSALVPAGAPGAPTKKEADLLAAEAAWLMRGRAAPAADSARRLLERALTMEPTSPVLATQLARAYLLVLQRGGANPPVALVAALRRIEELAAFALSRDPVNAAAWTVRAIAARFRDPERFRGALAAHAKALALAPRDADAVHELGITYHMLGNDARAFGELRRALLLEPERPATLAALAELELRAGRHVEACAMSNAAIAANSFDAAPYAVRALARLQLGQARDAFADAETAARLSTEVWTDALRLFVNVRAGDVEKARALGNTLARRYLSGAGGLGVADARMLAIAYLEMGDRRRALDALERAHPRGRELATALGDRAFDPIRQDVRFRALTGASGARGSAGSSRFGRRSSITSAGT